MSKNAEDLFVERGELVEPTLKGAMLKWIRNKDKVTGPDPAEGMAHYYKQFESWINRKVNEDWYTWKNKHSSQDEMKEVMIDLYNSHDEFNSLLWEKAEPYKGTDNNWKENGKGYSEPESEDEESQSGGNNSNSHPYPELHDVGVIDENGEPVTSKLMGTMLAWSKDAQTVEGPEEDVSPEVAEEAWFSWMMDKFEQEWINFTMRVTDSNELEDTFKKLWNDREDFRNRVEEKYQFDEELLEGKQKPDESSGDEGDGGQGSSTDEKPGNGLRGWAEKEGTTDSTDAPKSNADSRTQETVSGSNTAVSDGGTSSKNRSLSQKQEKPEGPNTLDSFAQEYGTAEDIKHKGKELETETIHRGHCVDVMMEMPKNSVDCVVTSPPYWGGVRDYDGEVDTLWQDGEWEGQLGHEPHPDDYVDNLMEVIDGIERVMKPTGCLWFNVGDVYGGASGGYYDEDDYDGGSIGDDGYRQGSDVTGSMPEKSLCGVPERFMLKMLDKGWVLRNKIRWVKQVLFENDEVRGATMPSAATDRFVEKSVEVMYFFTPQKHYDFDLDPVRRPHKTDASTTSGANEDFYNDEGGNLPVAWQINYSPTSDDHHAPFPETLVERPIKSSAPKGGVVLDPFAGTATTCEKAAELSRHYVGIELSEQHIKTARENCPDTLQFTFS